MNNLAEQGRTFLTENTKKYTLRLIDAIAGETPQTIELCRVDDKGEAVSVFALDMDAVFSQCAPVNIVNHIKTKLQDSVQVGTYVLHNHKHESVEAAYQEFNDTLIDSIDETLHAITALVDCVQHPDTPLCDTPF